MSKIIILLAIVVVASVDAQNWAQAIAGGGVFGMPIFPKFDFPKIQPISPEDIMNSVKSQPGQHSVGTFMSQTSQGGKTITHLVTDINGNRKAYTYTD